jgi:hypothetical protein
MILYKRTTPYISFIVIQTSLIFKGFGIKIKKYDTTEKPRKL